MVDSGYDDAADAHIDDDVDADVGDDQDGDYDQDGDEDPSDNLHFQVTAVRQTSNTPQFHALSGNHIFILFFKKKNKKDEINKTSYIHTQMQKSKEPPGLS